MNIQYLDNRTETIGLLDSSSRDGWIDSETPNSARARWMLVDDDELLLHLLSELLERLFGIEVHCFSSGEAAVAAFEAERSGFSLVLTDLDMPGLNGIGVCQRLRNINPDCPIVLITGSQNIISMDAIRYGFKALIRKPFSISDLDVLIDLSRDRAVAR